MADTCSHVDGSSTICICVCVCMWVHVCACGFMCVYVHTSVDAHSDWMGVKIRTLITSSMTIVKLHAIFIIHGLPQKFVTDNDPNFTSNEFLQVMHSNGIHHVTSALYHSSNNGSARQ